MGKNDATFRVLEYFYHQLGENYSNMDIKFIGLADYNFEYCLNCRECYKTGVCAIKDDRIEEVHAILKNSDGIIYGSTANMGGISGLLYNFQQRTRTTAEQLLYHKPCIVTAVYENFGGMAAINELKRMVINGGGYVVRSLPIKEFPNQDPLDERNKGRIENTIEHYVRNLFRIKPPLPSRVYTALMIHLFLKPYLLKNPDMNRGILSSWIERNIIGRKRLGLN